jgi:hypothetical protein
MFLYIQTYVDVNRPRCTWLNFLPPHVHDHLIALIRHWILLTPGNFIIYKHLYSVADKFFCMLLLTNGTIVYLVLLMKAYAISGILKIFAFEIALGRKIDMLPEVNENMKLHYFRQI